MLRLDKRSGQRVKSRPVALERRVAGPSLGERSPRRAGRQEPRWRQHARGWDCSLVRLTIGEPSRSCHGESHVRQSQSRTGAAGPCGYGDLHARRSDHGKGETLSVPTSSAKTARKAEVRNRGSQRECDGSYSEDRRAEQRARSRRTPTLIARCVGRERRAARFAGQLPDGHARRAAGTKWRCVATCRGHALAQPRGRLLVAAKRPQVPPTPNTPRFLMGDSLGAALAVVGYLLVALPRQEVIGKRVRETARTDLKGNLERALLGHRASDYQWVSREGLLRCSTATATAMSSRRRSRRRRGGSGR